jgi:predicted secreted protein
MNLPTTIALKVGEGQTLRLPSLGTAGYVWNYTIEGDADTIAVTLSRVEASQSEEPSIAGASSDEIVTIMGQAPGRASLYLVQQRPWETNQPPLKSYHIEVTVQR